MIALTPRRCHACRRPWGETGTPAALCPFCGAPTTSEENA